MQSITPQSISRLTLKRAICNARRPEVGRCLRWTHILVTSHAPARLNPSVARLRPSKTVAVGDLAAKLKEQGKDVINLAIGEPDFPTPRPICEAAIEAIQQGFTKYTTNSGMRALRRAIAIKLKRENALEYDEDCIVVSNGAKQAAWQAILATCGPGDEVLIPAPYWVSYPEMAVLAGASPKIIPCPMGDEFQLTPASLTQALTPKSRLLILCSPSNPTGAVYTREQLEALAVVVRQHPQLIVLSDEIYEYITYPPAEHISIASLPGMYSQTLTVNGFSKGFSMTGWRLGYVAAPKPFAEACCSIQSHCTSAPSSISQKAGSAALGMGDKGGHLIADMVEIYRHRRDFVVNQLRSTVGVRVLEPQGAFYVFPDFSAFLGNNSSSVQTAEELCMFLLDKANVAVTPGDAFGAPGHIRISYAASFDRLQIGLYKIEEALKQL